MRYSRFLLILVTLCLGLTCSISSTASDKPRSKPAKTQAPKTDDQSKPEEKPKQKKNKNNSDQVQYYKKWLDEDVQYIISEEERSVFKSLKNDEERDSFIEQFWARRNPNPRSGDNTFKEEHYRRIAYANEHFASGIPGWKTDRGRTYIIFGPPDALTDSASSGSGTHRTQVWVYKYLEGIGTDVEFKFVDVCDCGDYPGQSVRFKEDGNSP